MAATKAGKSALDIQVTKHSSDKLIWVKKEKKKTLHLLILKYFIKHVM